MPLLPERDAYSHTFMDSFTHTFRDTDAFAYRHAPALSVAVAFVFSYSYSCAFGEPAAFRVTEPVGDANSERDSGA